jgi:hypothetical protein
LAHPASSTVAELVGTDVPFKLLAVCTVEQALEPLRDLPADLGAPLRRSDTLKDALLAMVACGQPRLPVTDGAGVALGQVTLHGLHRLVAHRAHPPAGGAPESGTTPAP